MQADKFVFMGKSKKIFVYVLVLLFGNISYDTEARSNFLDNEDDTVTHATTRLMWQNAPDVSARSYAQAVSYCSSLEFAGHNDWRLPRLKELLSLVDYKRFNPALDPIVFRQMPDDGNIWAHSQFQAATTVWVMNTFEGRIEKYGAPSSTVLSALPVCVRSAS